jgi:hypothetical protein
MPVTTPVATPTEARAVLLLLHEPPAVASARVSGDPMQTRCNPVIGAGSGLTVAVTAAKQRLLSVYFITDVPIAVPDTIPVDEPMAAIVVVPLLHVPPG